MLQEYADKYLADSSLDNYDNLLWAIVTAKHTDLNAFAKMLICRPYFELPVPLLVAIGRLTMLENNTCLPARRTAEPTQEERLAFSFAEGTTRMHCSKGEEEQIMEHWV